MNTIRQNPKFKSTVKTIKTTHDLYNKIHDLLLYQHLLDRNRLRDVEYEQFGYIDIEKIDRVYVCKILDEQQKTYQLAVRMRGNVYFIYMYIEAACDYRYVAEVTRRGTIYYTADTKTITGYIKDKISKIQHDKMVNQMYADSMERMI